MESNTLMEIERWSVTRGSGSRAGKGIDVAHAASRPPPPMRSAPARMDVLHSPYCAASASWEVPRTDASTRHAPAPAVPHALAARSLLRVPHFLQLERWAARLLLSRGSMRRLLDAAAGGAARSPAPVNGRRTRGGVDLGEEQWAGSGAAPRNGGRRLLPGHQLW